MACKTHWPLKLSFVNPSSTEDEAIRSEHVHNHTWIGLASLPSEDLLDCPAFYRIRIDCLALPSNGRKTIIIDMTWRVVGEKVHRHAIHSAYLYAYYWMLHIRKCIWKSRMGTASAHGHINRWDLMVFWHFFLPFLIVARHEICLDGRELCGHAPFDHR